MSDMSPQADQLLAALDFKPTCSADRHKTMTVPPEAFWTVWFQPCCAQSIASILCDDCMFEFWRPEMRAERPGHSHDPPRGSLRLVQPLNRPDRTEGTQ